MIGSSTRSEASLATDTTGALLPLSWLIVSYETLNPKPIKFGVDNAMYCSLPRFMALPEGLPPGLPGRASTARRIRGSDP